MANVVAMPEAAVVHARISIGNQAGLGNRRIDESDTMLSEPAFSALEQPVIPEIDLFAQLLPRLLESTDDHMDPDAGCEKKLGLQPSSS